MYFAHREFCRQRESKVDHGNPTNGTQRWELWEGNEQLNGVDARFRDLRRRVRKLQWFVQDSKEQRNGHKIKSPKQAPEKI